MLHLYMSEKISDVEACKKLVKISLENHRLPYITVTPTFSICRNHGYLSGEHQFCPECDSLLLQEKASLNDEEREPCEVWTRVMGYHRPVSCFNIGKTGEHHERIWPYDPGRRRFGTTI